MTDEVHWTRPDAPEVAGMMAELLHEYVSTGPRQPEARELYLAAGFTPLFDVTAPPVTGPLPFEKALLVRT